MKTISYIHMTVHPSEQIGCHVQPTWELSYVIKGHGMRTMGSQQEHFHTGEVVLVPPDMKHCWAFDGEETIECITLQISPDIFSGLATLFPEMESVANIFSEYTEAIRFTGVTLKRLQAILKRMENENDAERIVSMLSMLVAIVQSEERQPVGRQRTEAEVRLERIKIYISCNYNHDICIDNIANHIGLNRSTLCTFFRQQTGKTLVEAINARRLEVARNLLRRNDMTIQQVCFASGFKDVPYFFRLFKRMEGITPKDYRNTVK